MFEPLGLGPQTPEEKAMLNATVVSAERQASCSWLDLAQTEFGKGRVATFEWADGMVSLVDVLMSRSVLSHSEAREDLLVVRANISSACTYKLDDDAVWRFVRPALTVSFAPAGTKFDVLVGPDTVHVGMTMFVRPVDLLGRYGFCRDDLPAPLVLAIEGHLTEPTHLFSLPIEGRTAALVDDIVHSKLPNSLRVLQVSARRVELLLLMVAAWNEHLAAGNERHLRARDAFLISAACRILKQRLAEPPTLQELARELGTNRSKLHHLFQTRLGVTPKTFCVQHRIERAQTLLHEGRLSVAQVAEAVGYQHQSSFAAAFRDVVGMRPSDYGNSRRDRQPECVAA